MALEKKLNPCEYQKHNPVYTCDEEEKFCQKDDVCKYQLKDKEFVYCDNKK